MFKILKNSEATSTQLAEIYVQAVKLGEAMATEKGEIYQRLMAAQIDSFDRKPSRELNSVKVKMDDIDIRLDACKFGQGQLKIRIGEALQKEAQDRLEEIKKELAAVSSEEKTLKRQYLDLCARAALVREELKGAETTYNGQEMIRLTPNVKFDFQLLSGEEQKYYSARVEEIRQESGLQDFTGTITGKRSLLVDEQTSLGKMLSGDPQEEAQRLLNKLLPPAPEPEEPETRKTQTFIKDYDKAGPVDYEEGEELPFKSVDEVLQERNS